jgi:hypothetical protein
VVFLFAAAVSAEEWSVTSPDGHTQITLTRDADGRLSWRALRDKSVVVEDSALGIRRADQSLAEGLKLVRASASAPLDERYETPHGKRRLHHVRANERTVSFANASGAGLDVVLRAHDDGVAFRFRFPETDATPRTVVEERSTFHLPAGTTGLAAAASHAVPLQAGLRGPLPRSAGGHGRTRACGLVLPGLFKDAGRVVAADHGGGARRELLRLALRRGRARAACTACASRIRRGRGGRRGEPDLDPALDPALARRHHRRRRRPHRRIDLVSDLSPPSASRTRAGSSRRASWSWWSESDSPKHAEALNRFVDLRAEMGWEYSLVDANWNFMETGKIEDVVAHAREKGVGLLFWYNSGGPHNDVTEAPRDRMLVRDVRRAEFAKLRDWGVRGVKVDFWQSDKQDRIRQYRDVLADAADFHLLVNFHGCTLPRGWSREFPHLVGMEGVMGAEQYKFSEEYTAKSAWHNTVLPFTRNVPGEMDYTPVTFTDHKYPHRTTNAHELALSVVFEVGVQHCRDSDKSYRALPGAPKTFLTQVPAAWDEMRVLSGEPGRSCRRRAIGRVWYVGGYGQESAADGARGMSFLGRPRGLWRDDDPRRRRRSRVRQQHVGA